MGSRTRYFVRTFKRDASGVMKTVEIIELRSRPDAMAELEQPPPHVDGALALAVEIGDAVVITLMGRHGAIPAVLAQLYDVDPA